MRVLAVGEDSQIGGSIVSLQGISGISVGRVDNSLDALDILDGVETVFVVLPIQDAADPSLPHIRTLVSQGAVVVVLAAVESAPLRAAAFAAGARDIVFPPFEKRVHTALLSLLGHPDRRDPRFATEMAALIAPPGEADRPATVRNLSRGGFMAEMAAPPIRRGLVVRAALNPPAPHRFPLLFAQTLSAEPLEDKPGRVAMHARFLGLTTEELLLLDRYLDTLSGSIEDRPTLLRNLDRLDADALRSAAKSGVLAGTHLPLLTELERGALSSPVGSAAVPLLAVAVARCRSSMIAALIDAHPELATAALPRFADWGTEIRAARVVVHDELSRALGTGGNSSEVRQLRDLQARVNAAADHLERIAAGITGEPAVGGAQSLQEASTPAVFDKAAPPVASPVPPSASTNPHGSRGRWLQAARATIGVMVLAAAVAAYVSWSGNIRARRAVDVAQTLDAPVAIEEAGGLRVRSTWREGSRAYAAIDASWYRLPEEARGPAAAAVAEKIRARDLGAAEVVLRDYRGRTLATVSISGDVTLSLKP